MIPLSVVDPTWEMVDSRTMLFIMLPVPVVVLVRPIGVSSFALFVPRYPVSFINYLVSLCIDKHPVSVLFASLELSLVLQVLG